MSPHRTHDTTEVRIHTREAELEGFLTVPADCRAIVVFAHGSGSSRFSPRNTYIAEILNDVSLATLLFDLLTAEENEIDMVTRELRFDIPLLTRRQIEVVDWLRHHKELSKLSLGLFGASTGSAAALGAAAARPDAVNAVVSRGGRPDLVPKGDLQRVRAPTLLIVGGLDTQVIAMNEAAASQLQVENRIEIVPGATHLFEEPGKLEEVGRLASEWFLAHLINH
jgi:putative phosphoribosyl transferase